MNGKRSSRAVTVVAAALALVCNSSLPALAANKLIVKDSQGVNDKFVVTDSGSIGSGTSTPSTGLHIKGTANPSAQIISQYDGAGSTSSGGISTLRTQANKAFPLNGDRLGYILFGGLDCTVTGAVDGCKPNYSSGFFSYADGNWTSASTPSYYVFETTRQGTNYRNEWMRITSSGNIGIGTPVPAANLEVNGGLRLIATAVPATPTTPARYAPTKPVCDNTNGPNIRGTMWFTKGSVGVADTLEVCAKQSNENYAWKPLF